MSLFKSRLKTADIDDLFGQYADVLENGPKGGGTIFHLSELPADKRLIKAVLLQKAYETGEASKSAMGAGFVQLGAFQADVNELSGQGAVVTECEKLLEEWNARACFSMESNNA